jgi:predicted ATPase
MAMQAESLDVLEKANVPAPQARAIVRAIEIELDGARDTLATKHDIELLRQDLTALGHELKQDMTTLDHELKQDMTQMRRELEVKIASAARDNLRYTCMAILAQTGILAGIVFALAHVRR